MNQKFIPLSVPNLKGNELEYVTHAVETEWVSTGGPYVNAFEDKIAQYAQCIGAVSCQNGTSGLHIALEVCGVTKNDEVIVPTLTFIAAVNPVKYVGAEPVFMDCDDSLTMDVDKLNNFCKSECKFVDGKLINNTSNKHIKALIVVHVFGNMADMEGIIEIANKYNLKVIEDATEAIGTYYLEGRFKGKHAGTIGDIGVYSFNGNKIITTGGGGMIVSNNKLYLEKAKHLTTQAKSDELYYTHDEIGYNYRMTNLQAALGLAQLEQLENFINVKKTNYDYYKKAVKSIPGLRILDFKENIRPNYWFYAYGMDLINGTSVFDFDVTKLSIYTLGNGLAGIEVYDLLRDEYDIQIEFGDICNILAYISIGDRLQDIERLVGALADIERLYKKDSTGMLSGEYIAPAVVASPQQAFYAEKESLPMEQAAGRISGEFVMCYPPGIPILAPGEMVTQEIVEYILYARDKGCSMQGMEDPKVEHLQVLKGGI